MDKKLSQYIDHTLLKPSAQQKDIEKLCQQAIEYQFFGVCINPYYLKFCKTLLANSQVKLVSVVGFPLGANQLSVKLYEATHALNEGADELDMVINVGALKDKNFSIVEQEISSISKLKKNLTLKVIIETSLLTEQEKIEACKLSVQGGASFVKTSTGFSNSGATIEDIKLIRKTIGQSARIKASGGIRDYTTALKMIEAGADRLGTSHGVSIVTHSNDQTSNDKRDY